MDHKVADFGIQLIQTVGFPIVVACWLLFKTDKRLEQQTEALNELNTNIKLLIAAVTGESK